MQWCLEKGFRCSKLCGTCCRASKLLSCGVTPFWFEPKCRCWVTSWRVAWLKLLQRVSSMLWPCQHLFGLAQEGTRIELVFQWPSMHQVFSMKAVVLSKHAPARLQSWWSYDPALVVLHDGIWDVSISSIFGCRRSDAFAWLYVLKIKLSSWISYALQVSTVFNFPHAFQLLPQPVVT